MTQDPEFYADRVRLMRYERGSGQHEEWLGSWDRTPQHWEFGADGRLYLEAEDRGRTSLFVFAGTGHPRLLVEGGSVAGVAPASDGTVFFTRQSLSAPSEVYACGPKGGDARVLTHFTEPVMSRVSLGEVRELSFKGAYGETVQMLVVLPPGHTASFLPSADNASASTG